MAQQGDISSSLGFSQLQVLQTAFNSQLPVSPLSKPTVNEIKQHGEGN
jgi:hypothetical protein